jgi:predicted acylesterase/phospholipase RssA/CRP-like cAMP-binding protein
VSEPPNSSVSKYDLLSGLSLFSELPESSLHAIAGRAASVHLTAGSTLMREGGPGDALYGLVSGRLRVFAEQPDGSHAAVGEVSPGEVVGEMALISNEPHTATVKAIRDSHLLEITSEDFVTLGREEPTVMPAVARLMVARLRKSIHHSSRIGRVRTLAIVPAGRATSLDGFVGQLATAFESIGSVSTLSVDTVEAALGKGRAETPSGSAADLELVAWLNRMEADHDVVIYVVDPEVGPWTYRSLRQADRVLVVGRAQDSPIHGELESSLHMAGSDTKRRADLVIVHPAATTVSSGTSRWLAGREIGAHHHVRDGHAQDFGRLARSLSGRSVSLVLSGGGARGLAHIGVLRALEEADVPVDFVGGASFGSLIGAAIARGDDSGSIRESTQRLLIDRPRPLDVTAPAAALTGGRRIVAMLQDAFGETQIEDLWRRFFCVSSNLTKARVRVHTTGPIWQALRASISIPGLFPPVNSGEGDVLVDGAVMNNLPVDVMRSLSDGGPVLAVNLRGEFPLRAEDLPRHGVLSGWKVYGKRLNPLADALSLPGIIDVLLRTTEVGSVLSSKTMEKQADVVFHPQVDDVGLLDFSAVDRLIDAGYRHAVHVLEEGGLDRLSY